MLNYYIPLDLLVTAVLSAQAMDEQVKKITNKLFEKYHSAKDYTSVSREELEKDIRSPGFYRRKAGWINEAF
jgi:endonuclease-3